jgi:hypothetical protein
MLLLLLLLLLVLWIKHCAELDILLLLLPPLLPLLLSGVHLHGRQGHHQ